MGKNRRKRRRSSSSDDSSRKKPRQAETIIAMLEKLSARMDKNEKLVQHLARSRSRTQSLPSIGPDRSPNSPLGAPTDHFQGHRCQSPTESRGTRPPVSPVSQRDGTLPTENVEYPKLTDDILELLGEDPTHEEPDKFLVHPALIPRLDHLFSVGLTKEALEALLRRYPTPSNVAHIKAPALNPEVTTILTDYNLKKDGFQAKLQNQIINGTFAVVRALTFLLEQVNTGDSALKDNVLPPLYEGVQVLADVVVKMSNTRKLFISPLLSKHVKEIATASPSGGFLYGPDLGDKIKAAKSLEITGKQLKAPSSSTVASSSHPSTSKLATSTTTRRNYQPQPSTSKNWGAPPRPSKSSPKHRGGRATGSAQQYRSSYRTKSRR